jgi:hypothetical protein
MSASYEGWLSWASAYESEALTGFEGDQISLDAYNESVDMCSGCEGSLPSNTFILLVYKLALHAFIMNSEVESAPVNTLYTKYSIAQNGQSGILQSASDSGTSSSRAIPSKVMEGDMATMLLWATPYGRWVESIFEQLGSMFAAVVR